MQTQARGGGGEEEEEEEQQQQQAQEPDSRIHGRTPLSLMRLVAMQKSMAAKHKASRGSQHFRAKANNRVDDLQGMVSELQQARREGRLKDVALLEEQMHQMLREWKAELREASPASSLLQVASPSSSELSSDMERLLQLNDEDDDATSKAAPLPSHMEQSHLEQAHMEQSHLEQAHMEQSHMEQAHMEQSHMEQSHMEQSHMEQSHMEQSHMEQSHMEQQQPYNHRQPDNSSQQESANAMLEAYARTEPIMEEMSQANVQSDIVGAERFDEVSHPPPLPPQQNNNNNHNHMVHHQATCELPTRVGLLPPPSVAFLNPKCALWDCPRPARGGLESMYYCSVFHEELAVNEGAPGMCPVVRPGGIDLKDGPLFAALGARVGGHAVGIPELQGAATSKSPWNAPDLFDVKVHLGETLREWLFFDKPRRAFESGTRKQRSLPDYGGRGWHESRKQVMKDLGGLKRSYYMDPQPEGLLEWHMYEYELTNCTDCALYRLELKQVDASKKSGKSKAQTDTSAVASLQHQIGRLSADLSQFDGQSMIPSVVDSRDSNRGGRVKSIQKKPISKNVGPGPLVSAISNQSLMEHTPFNYTAELQ